MTAKVFEAALGMAMPWSVASVDFDEAAKLLTILIDFKPGSRFAVSGYEGVHPVHDTAENINTTTPSGKLTFHIFAALAEFERDILRQRVNAGLAAVRKRGRVGGRKPLLTEADLKKARALLRSGDYSQGQVAKELNVSRHTLWRALAKEATP